MIINIISNQFKKTKTRGPKKVLDNTIKGLELLGVTYVVNQPIEKCDYNWVQDNPAALIQASFLKKPCVFGPNLAVFPSGLPFFRKKIHSKSLFLFPSNWPMNVWEKLNFNECSLKVWPSGVDTELFNNNSETDNNSVLVYFKNRNPNLLEEVTNKLKKVRLNFVLFEYGEYEEEAFLKAVKSSKFGVWIGGSESQGYALLEALSCNLPLLVIDIKDISEVRTHKNKSLFSKKAQVYFEGINISSVPYFNKNCGLVINGMSDFEEKLTFMNLNYHSFEPRAYILEHFTLESTTKNLIQYFDLLEVKKTKAKNNYYYTSLVVYFFQLIFRTSSWKSLIRKFL
jgi:hypothetical protein